MAFNAEKKIGSVGRILIFITELMLDGIYITFLHFKSDISFVFVKIMIYMYSLRHENIGRPKAKIWPLYKFSLKLP